MQKEELLKEIEEEKINLFAENNKTDEQVEFFKKFNDYFNSSTIETIINIDIFDFITAYLTAYSKKYSFQEIEKVINQCKLTYENSVSEFLFLMDNIQDIIEKSNDINDTKQKELKNNIKFIDNIKNKTQIDIDSLMTFYFENDMIAENMMGLVMAFLCTQNLYSLYKESIKIFEKQFNHKATEKEQEQILLKISSLPIKIKDIKEEFKNLERYTKTVISKDKNDKRKTRKELDLYMYIETWIKSNKNKNEITNIPKEIIQIKNKDLSNRILKYVYEYNIKEYSNLKKEYDYLLSNSYNQYSLLFERYNINIAEYNINITKNIKDVESMLEILYSLNFKDTKDIISIINNSTIEIVKNIQNLVNEGYISTNLITKNIGVFSNSYINIIQNIELYQSENLSISNINKMENTLDKDTMLIKKNIQILKDYKLFEKIVQPNSKEFMIEENLDKKIDRILELGLETYLQQDLNLLNQDIDSFKRIIILKRLNIPIEDISELYSILENKKFVISNQDIDNYIFDANKYSNKQIENCNLSKQEFISSLEEFKNTELTYSFDGVFISKNKVIRNINNIENDNLSNKNQLDAVISETILDDFEYEKIITCLTAKNKQLKKS